MEEIKNLDKIWKKPHNKMWGNVEGNVRSICL